MTGLNKQNAQLLAACIKTVTREHFGSSVVKTNFNDGGSARNDAQM